MKNFNFRPGDNLLQLISGVAQKKKEAYDAFLSGLGPVINQEVYQRLGGNFYDPAAPSRLDVVLLPLKRAWFENGQWDKIGRSLNDFMSKIVEQVDDQDPQGYHIQLVTHTDNDEIWEIAAHIRLYE